MSRGFVRIADRTVFEKRPICRAAGKMYYMSAAKSLITDLETSLSRRSSAVNEAILSRVADLFIGQAPHYRENHVDLFDEVILRLAAKIEEHARAELAVRLADVANAPRKTIHSLADDTIAVAERVLQRSVRLSETDLTAIAQRQSNDHLLAISSRAFLSSSVTDVLVVRGDERVVQSVAGNAGAQLSEFGFDRLVDRSKDNAELKAVLGRRSDIPVRHLQELVEAARQQVSERLKQDGATQSVIELAIADLAIADSARRVEKETAKHGLQRVYTPALTALTQRLAESPLTEHDLVEYARHGRFEEVVCTLSYLGKVPLAMAERLFTAPETDLILVFSRGLDLNWQTVRAMLPLRGTKLSSSTIADLLDSYQKLTPKTAQRVLAFLHQRKTGKSA